MPRVFGQDLRDPVNAFVAIKFATVLVCLPLLVWKPAWVLPILALNIAEAVVFAMVFGYWDSALAGLVTLVLVRASWLFPASEVVGAALVVWYIGWNTHFSLTALGMVGTLTAFVLNLVPGALYALDRLLRPSQPVQGSLWLFVLARFLVILYATAHVVDPGSCHRAAVGAVAAK